jgi:GTPase SAR1 family protein
MKKSVLIVGQRCSGKTTLLKKMLSNYSQPKSIVFSELFECSLETLKTFDVIGIEEVVNLSQLLVCIYLQKLCQLNFVLTSQIDIKELDEFTLSNLEIVQL